jgi:hypothetical protein
MLEDPWQTIVRAEALEILNGIINPKNVTATRRLKAREFIEEPPIL